MSKVRRESIGEFWTRVEQEGRRAQAEAARQDLLTRGRSKRDAQRLLVLQFQPLDGAPTRSWPTPDSWACGRCDAKMPPPDRQELFEQDVLWVHENLQQPLEQAPTPGARLLLETAQKRPETFLRVYVQCLPGIVERAAAKLNARRKKVEARREARRRRAAADKRAAYRAAQARKQTAAQQETRRGMEAQKQEQKRLRRQEKQSKSLAGGPLATGAAQTKGGEDRVVI